MTLGAHDETPEHRFARMRAWIVSNIVPEPPSLGRNEAMSDDRFDAMLDMNDPDFANKLAEAIGVKPGDTVEISGPQFTRTDGLAVPLPVMDFARLPGCSKKTLKAIGCQMWDGPDENGQVLWLYPAEWYDHIPDGTIVTDINGKTEAFKRGETDDDRRFGALAYGFHRQADKP